MPFGTDNLCVWHVPKSGGTWLREAMTRSGLEVRNLGKPHATVVEYTTPHLFNAVIVRRPVEWYSSAWRWMRAVQEKGERIDMLADWFPWLDDEDLQDFPRFLVRHAGCYQNILDAYTPLGCVRLRAEYLGPDARAWLVAAGVEFNAEELLKTPPQNVTNEPPPSVPIELLLTLEGTN